MTKDGLFGWGTATPSVFFNISGGDALFEMNATIDSLLTVRRLIVLENAEINGQLTVGKTLTFDGISNSISSSTGTVDFAGSDITTSGSDCICRYCL